jgi:hypothetical protein
MTLWVTIISCSSSDRCTNSWIVLRETITLLTFSVLEVMDIWRRLIVSSPPPPDSKYTETSLFCRQWGIECDHSRYPEPLKKFEQRSFNNDFWWFWYWGDSQICARENWIHTKSSSPTTGIEHLRKISISRPHYLRMWNLVTSTDFGRLRMLNNFQRNSVNFEKKFRFRNGKLQRYHPLWLHSIPILSLFRSPHSPVSLQSDQTPIP